MMLHFVNSVDSCLGHDVHGLLVQLLFQPGVQGLERVMYDRPYDGVIVLRHEDARLSMLSMVRVPCH